MNKIKHIAKKSLGAINSRASKQIIKHFIDKYNFIYFGSVDSRNDDLQIIRGLTASANHSDAHYSIGSYNSYDAILVERQSVISFPGKKPIPYNWLILQIDLKRSSMPHIFIDSKHHDTVFYANALLSKNGIQDMSGYFSNLSQSFNNSCKIFASPSDYYKISLIITPEIAETLGRHFSQFDYELFDDKLLIYTSNSIIKTNLPEEMLRVGVWLANQFDALQI